MKTISCVLLILIFSNVTYAVETINIKEFTAEVKEYAEDAFPELADDEWLADVLKRKGKRRRTRFSAKNSGFII